MEKRKWSREKQLATFFGGGPKESNNTRYLIDSEGGRPVGTTEPEEDLGQN